MGSVLNFASGIESNGHWEQAVRGGVRNVLAAYLQFWQNDGTFVARRHKERPKTRFMIDSGAHTFRQEAAKFAAWRITDYENYVDKYVRWLWDNRAHIYVAVELDIASTLNENIAHNHQSQLGLAKVQEWRERLFQPLVKRGIEVIFVWHEEDGFDAWEPMCAKFAYLGLPGNMPYKPRFREFIATARKYTTKIHGFAATRQSDFRDQPWFSIDSITWKAGEIYGEMMDWDPLAQKLRFIRSRDLKTGENERAPLREKFIKCGFDADAIINPRTGTHDYKEVTRYSLWSMRQMEKFYADRYKDRLQYYELRLPPAAAIQTMGAKRVFKWAERMRPERLFKQHTNADEADMRQLLMDLSAVQYADSAALCDQQMQQRMAVYFPSLFNPMQSDPRVLQRELSAYLSPPIPPALERTDDEHFEVNDFAGKERAPVDYAFDDLTFDVAASPLYRRF